MCSHRRHDNQAFQLVRESKDIESAKLAADYALRNHFPKNAIEFSIISGQREEAYRIAKDVGELAYYGTCIINDGSKSEYQRLAGDLQAIVCKLYIKLRQDDVVGASTYLGKSGDHAAAVNMCINKGTPEAMSHAVRIAADVRRIFYYF